MELSPANLHIVTEYFKGNRSLFEQKDADYQNLLLTYASDNNSSSVREAVTLHALNYEQFTAKHGADGKNTVTGQEVEVKPKFVQEGRLGTTVGNFNDMTYELLQSKQNYSIVCSLFSPNSLIYIVEFPMSLIYSKLQEQITIKLSQPAGKRVVCRFSFSDYDNPLLKVHFFNKEEAIKTNILSAPHLKMLNRHYDK